MAKKKLKWTGRQVKSLDGSIKKWKGISDGKEQDWGDDNCSCCENYIEADCRTCPVSIFVNDTMCNGTPWKDWQEYWATQEDHRGGFYGKKARTKKQKELARKELAFLKKVRAAGV